MALAGWGVCLDVELLTAPRWILGAAVEGLELWRSVDLGAGGGGISGAFLSTARWFVGAAVEEALDLGGKEEEERVG